MVELVSRLVGMNRLVGTPLWARQLAALEALQIYAPLGHGLGLRALSSQLEDSSFQVPTNRHFAQLVLSVVLWCVWGINHSSFAGSVLQLCLITSNADAQHTATLRG